MNNIEKNLKEIYDKFYYPTYIEEIVEFLNSKFYKIIGKAKSEGYEMKEDVEKELMHNVFKEGVNYFLYEKLVKKAKEFEESISHQPMLLAHPNNVENKELLDCVKSSDINSLITEGYCLIEKPIYTDM